MKKIISKLMGGVLLFSLSMSLTSCEGALDDILGEWSRPTPGSSTGGAVAVTGIDLDADEMKLTVGDKGQLTAKVDPVGTAVTWSSDKEEIATVDVNGMVTAVAVGTAIITAKAGDKSATCEVTVLPTLSTPLTIEAITQGKITVTGPKAGMQYSLNGGAKKAVTTTSIDVAAGGKVAFYGQGISITSYDGTTIDGDGDGFKCKVYGNIMSLVDETGFATKTKLTATSTFQSLFNGNTKLTDASGLLLPATTLTVGCYDRMFQGCTALTAAPAELPATSLANSCYRDMFFGCTSLTTAPALSATELAEFCYASMFYNCSSLTTAPALPVTELKGRCYISMFCGCSSLTTAPKLPATTLAQECYASMFNGCSSLTTAYVKAAYTTTGNACNNMFNGCTNASTSTFYSDDAANWKSNFSTLSSWQAAAYPTE